MAKKTVNKKVTKKVEVGPVDVVVTTTVESEEKKVSFFQKYQVLVSAIASSLALIVQQFMLQPEIDWKAIGLAAAIAVAGIIGNEWRGKGVSVIGFLGIASFAFYTVQTTGNFSWQQFFLSFILGVLALVAPPPKSIGYEKTDIIKKAKKEGEVDVPTQLHPKPNPLEQ